MALAILLFDESDTARAGLARLLERRPSLRVSAAVGTVEAAANAVMQRQPDLLLMDLHTRDGNAAILCKRLRGMTSAPLVVLASFMTPERWGALKDAGADEFLLKRVDSAALERDLLRVGRQYARDGAGTSRGEGEDDRG